MELTYFQGNERCSRLCFSSPAGGVRPAAVHRLRIVAGGCSKRPVSRGVGRLAGLGKQLAPKRLEPGAARHPRARSPQPCAHHRDGSGDRDGSRRPRPSARREAPQGQRETARQDRQSQLPLPNANGAGWEARATPWSGKIAVLVCAEILEISAETASHHSLKTVGIIVSTNSKAIRLGPLLPAFYNMEWLAVFAALRLQPAHAHVRHRTAGAKRRSADHQSQHPA